MTPKPRGVLKQISMCYCVYLAERHDILVHRVNNDTLVLRAVLGPTANVGLDDVAAVEERHGSVLLDPDLVARVLREDGEGGDVQAELARLGEFACRDREC